MYRSGSFFACGDGVHMPSIRTGAGGRHVRSFTTPSSTATQARVENGSGPNKGEKEGTHSLKRRLTELSETLDFHDDVVSARSPLSLPYAKARGEMSRIFRLDDLRPGERSRTRRLGPAARRHYHRGEPKRHLCRLHEPEDMAQASPWRRGNWRRTRERGRGRVVGEGGEGERIGVQASLSDIEVDTSQSNYGSVARFHGNSYPGGMRTVPPSVSVLWEENTLCRLSDETARRLIEGCPRADERERLETILSRKQGKTAPEKPTLKQQHSTFGLRSLHGDKRDDSSTNIETAQDAVSLMNRDFLTALEEGARPVQQGRGDGRTIVLDNDARFEKVVQRVYPRHPVDWCGTEAKGDTTALRAGLGLGKSMVKGGLRWTSLPQPAKTPEELQWVCQRVESPDLGDSGNHSTAVTEKDNSFHHPPPTITVTEKECFNIMREWSHRWHIHVNLREISETLILEEMYKFSDNSKMLAITALAMLAESHTHLTSPEPNPQREEEEEEEDGGVFPDLVLRLGQLLEDEVEHVRVPAAITLHCLGREHKKAVEVLLAAVESHSASERWASVQCVAVTGVSTAPVVAELIAQLMGSHDQQRRERAAELLARLSGKTSLVHAMLAEWLNSRGWQERLAVCRVLPRLHGGINKDLSDKLVVLAWEDLSPEVREAAAQALGLTGQGKLIHDELKRRLSDSSETVRLDALKRLHSLHLITPQLLPPFLTCLTDDLVSIRIEAIEIAGSLRLKEKRVQETLLKLLQDKCWKVKAHTLRALGEIGCCNDVLKDQLLWMVRFEKVPGVRAETCRTIAYLGLHEEQVLKTLRDILTVDDNPLVLREVTLAMRRLGADTKCGDDMLEAICSEIKKLGTREAITQDILHTDKRCTADYVIESRPRGLPSTRDYLDEKYRRRQYPSLPVLSHSASSAERAGLLDQPRTWSPDRVTIDRQLEAMRKHCSLTAIGEAS